MAFLRSLFMALVCLCTVALTAPLVQADSVTYTFSGINSGTYGDGLPVALQFTSPTFITSLTPVFAAQLTSCTNCLVSTTVPAVEFRPNDTLGDAIGFLDVNQIEFFYRFPTGAFGVAGTYTTLSQSFPGILTVSTPEPTVLALLWLPLLGLIGLSRQCRAAPMVGGFGRNS